MRISNILFDFFLCVVEYGIVYYFFNLIFKKRFVNIFPVALTVFINSVIVYMCADYNVFIRSLVSIVTLMSGCSILYKNKPAEKVTYSFLALYILNIVEFITGGFVSIIYHFNLVRAFEWSHNRMHFSAYAKIFDILIFTLIYKMVSRFEPTLKNKYKILFDGIILVFFLFTTALMQFFLTSDRQYFFNVREVFMYTMIFFLIFVMSLVVIFFFTEISRSFQRDSKLLLLENNFSFLQEQIAVQQQNIDNARKLRHDMKNHLSNVRSLIESGETEGAILLLDKTAENVYSAQAERAFNTGNGFVDAILLSKAALCGNKNIDFTYNVQPLEEIKIDVVDLSSLLSNLLDNAVESAVQTSEPFIKLSIFKYSAYFTICVENSYKGEEYIKQNAGRLVSTKPDIAFHGYGTQIINDIALKYDGNFSWETRKNSFIATVLLKI